MYCPICNKEYKGKSGLTLHLSQKHLWNKKDIYIYENYTALNKEIPHCKICGKEAKFNGRYFSNTCGNNNCKHKYFSLTQREKYIKYPELKEKLREHRINYLLNKQNFIKTAWGKRANKELSYLENWFVNNIILSYNLQNKYDIVNDYFEKPYFLDFAFINIKLDVELDGKCHFDNGNNRIEHDIVRDNYLLQNGWKIFRISYLENNQDKINEFLDFLKKENFEYNSKYYNNVILKQSDIYKEKLNKIKQQRLNKKKEKTEKIRLILSNLKYENIDFSKFGWVKFAQKYLENNNIILKGNVRRYINKYYPEFFEEVKVFNRNMPS